MLQNFAAGLILAAVAGELFPLIAPVKGLNAVIGAIIGFTVSLSLIYGCDYFIGMYENEYGEPEEDKETKFYYQKVVDKGEWEEEFVDNASLSMKNPAYKQKLVECVTIMHDSVISMGARSKTLSRTDLTTMVVDEMAEAIDKEIHTMHYILDQARRLIQGDRIVRKREGFGIDCLVATEKKDQIQSRLNDLKYIIEHIHNHVLSDEMNKEIVKEIHDHMDEADRILSEFHESVESGFSKWRRSRPFPPTPIGSPLPMAIIVPICIDSIIDGFLIGVACALSFNAGIILASANVIEMSMLGMALSVRVSKCTGSPIVVRYGFIIAPPILILLGTCLGSYLGDISKNNELIFVSFVTFGIVALMYLACNELLIEASEIQNGKRKWYISIMTYAAVFAVIIVDSLLP